MPHMGDTEISWADKSWQPALGCTPVSPGCDHCYAAKLAGTRLAHVPVYEGLTVHYPDSGIIEYNGTVRLLPERLGEPAKWRKPSRIFVGSMTDLFHNDVPDEYIAQVFDVIAATPRHTFQVLTKRIQRARQWFPEWLNYRLPHQAGEPRTRSSKMIDNLWLGTSIESGRYGFRSQHLASITGCHHFLSIEPLIGPLTAAQIEWAGVGCVIVGGESGPSARPMHPNWLNDIYQHCERPIGNRPKVPFEFKQWGEWTIPTKHLETRRVSSERTIYLGDNGTIVSTWEEASELAKDRVVMQRMERVGKRAAGRVWIGREWNGSVVMTPQAAQVTA
jgi:protein gp37